MLNTISKDLKEMAADNKIWIAILTVLIIIIIGTSYNRNIAEKSSSELLKLGVINMDDSSYSELLLSYFNSSETFSSLITVVAGDNETIKKAFQKGELDIYLEIPKDFAQNMIKLEHSPVKVTINTKDTTKAIIFQNILKSYEKYIAAVEVNAVGLYEMMEQDQMSQELISQTNRTISLTMIFTALGKETFFSFQPVKQFPTTTLPQYYIIAILVMATMYAGLYEGFRILSEIRQGTFTRIRTTKTQLHQFLTAKLLLASAIVMATVTIAVDIIVGKVRSTGGIMLCLSISLFCILLAVFLSAFFHTTQRFLLVGNLLIFFFSVIGGGIIPIQFLPQALVRLAKMTPNFYMMKGIIYLKQGQMASVNHITMGFLLASALLYGVAIVLFSRRSVTYEE